MSVTRMGLLSNLPKDASIWTFPMSDKIKKQKESLKGWFFSEMSRLRKFILDWGIFWTSITSLAFSYILFYPLEKTISFVRDVENLYDYSSLLCGLVIVVMSTILVFLIKPSKQLSVQNIHKQPSWVFYTYWACVNCFLIWSLVMFFTNINSLWYIGFGIAVVVILLKWTNEWIGMKPDLNFKRFSPGAVGEEDDVLEFSPSAKNVATGLKRLKSYVNVVGLYGGFGFGKSSYARMVVENFEPRETLYTYISLTETNEAQDFSKLFAERWLETLSERYPKIDITSYLPFMDSILRESGNGILSGILKVISEFNRGLTKTKAFFFDAFYSTKENREKISFSSGRVSKLFGNITQIKEESWIIMVDEVERAQFDEIYRLVEIIERFKHEGRSGMPTKLIFILCISEPHFEEYLERHQDKPLVHSLKTFFYEDPKSVAHKIFLPPVDPSIKQRYIFNQLNPIIDREGIKVPKEVNLHGIGDPSLSFMDDHKEAVEHILSLIRQSSPRTINRISASLEFFYGAFRDRFGEFRKNSIRFSDILTLEYIKIRYPYLLSFFNQTIHMLINQAESYNIDAYFAKERIKDRKLDLIGWIEEVAEKKIPEHEKKDVLKIVGLVMYYYFDFLGSGHDTQSKDKYYGTTSYPEVMCDYLSLLAEGTTTSYRKNSNLFQMHKSEPEGFVHSLENGELLSYARFVFSAQNAPVQINIDLVEELSERIVVGKIPLDPMNVDNTSLDEASYQLTFQFVAVVEKDIKADHPTEGLEKVFKALKKVLLSEHLATGLKYLILSSLVNNERGGGSTIHLRLESVFQRLFKYYENDVRSIIKHVFKEMEDRYLNGDKVLYECEENFFWTLYQSWGGSKDAHVEIHKIRNAAKRGLKNNINALRLYWRNYPDPTNKNWKEFRDIFEDHRFFSLGDTVNPIYMSLADLILITQDSNIQEDEVLMAKLKFWDKVKDDSKLKEMSVIKDDPSTLKSYLVRNGFLDSESE